MDPDTLLLIVLLVRHSTTRIIVLIVYVDDINIISSDSKVIVALPHFLKIEVAHYLQGIILSQRKFMFDLLLETGLLGA